MEAAETRLAVKRFPAELHKRLRVVAARTGKDMRDIAIAGITAEVGRLEGELAVAERARAANPRVRG